MIAIYSAEESNSHPSVFNKWQTLSTILINIQFKSINLRVLPQLIVKLILLE